MADKPIEKPEDTKPKELIPVTLSSKFVDRVMTEFSAEIGSPLGLNPYQKTLAQHLYIKADSSLKDLEAKRLQKNSSNAPITWENVNIRKLAIDAAHRVNLGLDALIPNHIHIIPYWNTSLSKYDLDLRIGYEGKMYYRLEAAIIKPLRVVYELVYSNDEFQAIKFDMDHETESFQFKLKSPFDRGNFVGGFGYLVYEDPRLNVLVIVPKSEFERAEKMGNAQFWTSTSRVDMLRKTLITRVMNYIKPDPKKINSSYSAVEDAEEANVIEMDPDEKPIRPVPLPPPIVDVTPPRSADDKPAWE